MSLYEEIFPGICNTAFLSAKYYLALAFRAALPIVASVILHFGLFAAVAGKPVRAVWRPVASLHAFAIVPWTAMIFVLWSTERPDWPAMEPELEAIINFFSFFLIIYAHLFGPIASVALTFKPHFYMCIGARIRYIRLLLTIISIFTFLMSFFLAISVVMCT